MPRTACLPALLLAVLAAAGLAGCVSDAPEPGLPLQVPLVTPVGLQASYSYGPEHQTLRPVNLTVEVVAPGEFDHSYRYEGCPACDSGVRFRQAPDGSWARAEFACLPPFPDVRADECDRQMGGWAEGMGMEGPFFGVALIAGLPVGPEGTVGRVVAFGTLGVEARFHVRAAGEGLLEVEPVAPGAAHPYRVFLEPVPCNVFTGRVTVDTRLGLPVACMQDEAHPQDGSRESFGWTLTWTNARPGAGAPFVPAGFPAASPLRADGVRFPPREAEGPMPFGLHEALDFAALGDARVRDFLARPDVALGNSDVQGTGGLRTCQPACVQQDHYLWRISLRSGPEDLRVEVRKQVTTPGGVAVLELLDVREAPRDVPFATFPAQSPKPLGWYWERAQESVGVRPTSLAYSATARGDPANLEPFVEVGFRQGAPFALMPSVHFRNDGSIYLWMANGALEASDSGVAALGR